MLFKASDRQVKAIAVTALEACGVKAKQKDVTLDRVGPKAGIFIDTFGGKPVKLALKKQAENIWYAPDKGPPKSAGWLKKYDSYTKLVKTEKDVEVFGPVDADPKKVAEAKAKPTLAKDSMVQKAEEKRETAKSNKKAATKK